MNEKEIAAMPIADLTETLINMYVRGLSKTEALVMLLDGQGCTPAEIAMKIGTPQNNVYDIRRAAKKKLEGKKESGNMEIENVEHDIIRKADVTKDALRDALVIQYYTRWTPLNALIAAMGIFDEYDSSGILHKLKKNAVDLDVSGRLTVLKSKLRQKTLDDNTLEGTIRDALKKVKE